TPNEAVSAGGARPLQVCSGVFELLLQGCGTGQIKFWWMNSTGDIMQKRRSILEVLESVVVSFFTWAQAMGFLRVSDF
ncbi:MAG: hypothetical protein KDN22_34380, partial [Verrucomicrobiae bacterium]|nr:hypothetical protein [Verrucomicrobiae bacterium]